jgi:pimeloyl-ACP methyl ester carboxylesterase
MAGAFAIAERQVPVDGGDLAVFRLGDGPGLVGPAVVAVHGITSSSRAWLAVARALDGRAGLWAVDLRGRGASGGLPGPYGMATHVRDLLAALESVADAPVVLVGHSLGAYVVARFAASYPERVRALVLVDGGLTIPGTEGVDPQAFADAFLGPALARLRMRFSGREEYREWWRSHPALVAGLADGSIADHDLVAYADHDFVDGVSSVSEQAVRADVPGLVERTFANELDVPATMLCAPRGLLDDPNPMQPFAAAQAWARDDPSRRRATLVEGVNHYTITLGRRGARAVADAIAVTPSY